MFIVTLVLLATISVVICQDYVNSPTRYHSRTDSGIYSYGYDTGRLGSHQFHHEHKEIPGRERAEFGSADDVITNSIEYRPQRTSLSTPYRSTYPRSDYMTPKPYATTIKPHLIRNYRHSQNSRVYMAGRDYEEARTNRVPTSIHRIESLRPHVKPTNSVSFESAQPPSFGPEIRSMVHSATIPSISNSALNARYTGESSSYTSYTSPVSSISYSGTNIPSAVAAAPVAHSSIRIPTLINPSPVVYPISGIAGQPISYSGRGIPSPSAAARLRSQLLRSRGNVEA